MKKRIKTLGELQKHVNALAKRHGETAPCCVWMITRDDLVTVDSTNRDVLVDANTTKSIMLDIDTFEYGFIQDHLQRIVGNELTSRNL